MPQPQISVPKPCHEAWAAMTPIGQGRHCAACQKTVVDFSQQTDAEIRAYFKAAGRAGVCGRFNLAQLERPLQANKIPAGTSWRTWLALTFAVWAGREGATAAAQAQTPTEQRQPQPPAYLRGGDEGELRLRGIVVDSDTNEGLPGVTVLLLNSQYGVPSDASGRFELIFPASSWRDGQSMVSFSYVGYQSVKVPLKSKPSPTAEPLKIMLPVDTRTLGEPIITAGGAFYRRPWPWHPRTFWYWLTRPFRR